ncbi:MAG TPA: RNA polymerase sigma factor [Acidimicrobiales bacterium]|nr:RNA polymerase sigma factor [Acidimicrobiales bacterium]
MRSTRRSHGAARRRDGEVGLDGAFDAHAAEIWRYLASRLGIQAADDLLGEVFVRALEGRDRFDPNKGSARAWLYGIATNLCREDGRRRHRVHLGLPATVVAAPQPDIADAVVERDLVARALAELPDERRELLLLLGGAGLSYHEAALALGIPVGTVRSRYFRARRQLRASLANERSTDRAERRTS